jgi:hypothetical protein
LQIKLKGIDTSADNAPTVWLFIGARSNDERLPVATLNSQQLPGSFSFSYEYEMLDEIGVFLTALLMLMIAAALFLTVRNPRLAASKERLCQIELTAN